jgi:cell division protein FtsQ
MKKRSVLRHQAVKRRGKRDFHTLFRMVRLVGSGLVKALVLLTALVVISLSFLAMYHYLLSSPYLKLQQVAMTGADEEIRRDLIKMGNLIPGVSLLALNLDRLQQKMEAHPWVRSIRLEREFPHALIVEVEQQVPRALVVMDKLFYMNRLGEVFKEVADCEAMDLTVVTGVTGQQSKLAEQLRRAAEVMRALESEEGPWSLNGLSEIHFSQDGNISLYFKHLSAEIKLAREDTGRNVEELKKVVKHLSQAGRIDQVTSIDLNDLNGAVVSFRKG